MENLDQVLQTYSEKNDYGMVEETEWDEFVSVVEAPPLDQRKSAPQVKIGVLGSVNIGKSSISHRFCKRSLDVT